MRGALGRAGGRASAWASAFTDRFLPASAHAPAELHRLRMTLFFVWMGVGFTATFSALYAAAGSPISSLAVLTITAALLGVPFAIRRGISIERLGNTVVGATWLMTIIVASRSGGFASPVLLNVFLFPVVAYAVFGPRWATFWAALACLSLFGFWGLELAGWEVANDFPPRTLGLLRIASYTGDVASITLAIVIDTSARRATFRAERAQSLELERARVLDDVHDGVGAQLLGLLVQVRAGTLDPSRLTGELESCLDDLRVVVSSEAARAGDLQGALGEVRARFAPRFEAARSAATWAIDPDLDGDLDLDGASTIQCVRVLQEMLTNTLRHAPGAQVEIDVRSDGDHENLVLSVRDHGPGIDETRPAGRGLRSMRLRAKRLGGTLDVSPADPGTRVSLRVPVRGRAVGR